MARATFLIDFFLEANFPPYGLPFSLRSSPVEFSEYVFSTNLLLAAVEPDITLDRIDYLFFYESLHRCY